ncbi:adenylate kinase [Candidatus Micrarchaeota archaeon]|nr:adenylate kinase [Candidatus Micrarchaeota archaeon]
MRLVLLGPPGSGKGTLGNMFAQSKNIPHLSTGDMLRKEMAGKTLLGEKIAPIVNAGKLIPDGLMIDVLKHRLAQKDCAGGFVLDGFPRTTAQGVALDTMLSQLRMELDAVLLFNVSKKEIVRRLSGRRVCIQCGKIYTVDYAKGVCEKCGGRLGVREDDKPEVVEKRLEVYERQTEPLIGYYREKDVILEINGEQPPEKVLKDVLAILK